MESEKLTACRVAEAVNSGELKACQLIEETMARCKDLNGRLNLFISTAGAQALEQARAVDEKIKSGMKLPLAGVPVAVKDDFSYSALPTTYGSPAFKMFRSPYDAAAVEKMVAAGAVIIGKTNLDAMSMGSTTLTSPAGPALNPCAADRVAGSAGAAAVAAGICMIALDSDSGGALRQGASHCGVFGLRPTVGRVSRYGLNIFSSSFGQVGIAASSNDDIQLVLAVISGFDHRDASTAICEEKSPVEGNALEPVSIKIGWPDALFEKLEAGHREVLEQAGEKFQARGFQFTNLKLDLLNGVLQAYYVIAMAEASSNLSRFDGIRFGEAADAENLEELYHKSRRLILGPEARRRSIFGTFLLSEGSYDLYYRQALKVWQLVRQEFAAALRQCDMLLLPAVRKLPHPAAKPVDFCDLYEDDIFCAPVSMAGLPSLCLPAGKVDQLPIGMQLVGPSFKEEWLIETASRIFTEA